MFKSKIWLNLLNGNGQNQLEINGDGLLIKNALISLSLNYYFKDKKFIINSPSLVNMSNLINIFNEHELKVSKNIEMELLGKQYGDLKITEKMPLEPDQVQTLFDIVRLEKIILANEYGTGKTHTMIAFAISMNKRISYLGPSHTFYQVRQIIERYYGDDCKELALFDFVDITKRNPIIPDNEILIADEANLLITKKSICKEIGKNKAKFKIFIIPKPKLFKDHYHQLLQSMGLIRTKSIPVDVLQQLVNKHIIFRRSTVVPDTKLVIIDCAKNSLAPTEIFTLEPTKERLQLIRDLILIEKINPIVAEVKRVMGSTSKKLAIVSTRESLTDTLLDFLPRFKKYRPGLEDENFLILESYLYDESIEINSEVVLIIESVLPSEAGSSAAYRFYRKAKKQNKVSLVHFLSNSPVDKIITDSPLFASNKGQLNYIREQLLNIVTKSSN